MINQIRAFLLERGMVLRGARFGCGEAIPEVLENANENLTPRMRNLVVMLRSKRKDLELKVVEMNDEVERIARVRGLDWSGDETVLDRRQGEAVWDQQARQLLSSQDSVTWGSSSGAAIKARRHR